MTKEKSTFIEILLDKIRPKYRNSVKMILYTPLGEYIPCNPDYEDIPRKTWLTIAELRNYIWS